MFFQRLFKDAYKEKSGFPVNPEVSLGFEISQEYYKFDNSEQFLRYDSSIEDQQLLKVFVSESVFHDMSSYHHW